MKVKTKQFIYDHFPTIICPLLCIGANFWHFDYHSIAVLLALILFAFFACAVTSPELVEHYKKYSRFEE